MRSEICYACAPLEGITGYRFRNAHRRWFGGVDRYYAPFFSPDQTHRLPPRDRRELCPEHNPAGDTVPQLLTRSAEDFLWAAELLADLGYREVNLNLGCPSGTVTAKGKGSGFLRDPDGLDRFLEEIFSRAKVAISIKTRVGFASPEEFDRLLECFDRYPCTELIVHPRVRSDFYKGRVRLEAFALAVERSTASLCYNGDLTTANEIGIFRQRFPSVERVMLGRGLVGDPALAAKAKGVPAADRETLRKFHDTLYEGYAEAFDSRHNAMLRMKELWFYLIWLFEGQERLSKALKKAKNPAEYEVCVGTIFGELPLREDSAAGWRDQPIF